MDVPITGLCAPGYGSVKDAFAANFAERGEVGAAVCVVQDGEVVVDLVGGWADEARTRPWICAMSMPAGSISSIGIAAAAPAGPGRAGTGEAPAGKAAALPPRTRLPTSGRNTKNTNASEEISAARISTMRITSRSPRKANMPGSGAASAVGARANCVLTTSTTSPRSWL